MKSMLRILMAAALLSAPAAFAQGGQQRGGSTGAPHAWCDKDGDGICDYCGQPAGQCPGGQGQGQRRGRGGPNPNCPNPACPRNGSGQRR